MDARSRFLIALKQEAPSAMLSVSNSIDWRERALLAVIDNAFAKIKNLEEKIYKIESRGIDE